MQLEQLVDPFEAYTFLDDRYDYPAEHYDRDNYDDDYDAPQHDDDGQVNELSWTQLARAGDGAWQPARAPLECLACCREFYDERRAWSQPAFDGAFAFRDALLRPRCAQHRAMRADETTPSALDAGCCTPCLVRQLAGQCDERHLRKARALRGLSHGVSVSFGAAAALLRTHAPDAAARLASAMMRAGVHRTVASLNAAARSPSAFLAVACVASDCSALFVVDAARSACTHVVCPECRRADICFVCKTSYHFGASCVEHCREPSQATKLATTRQCPHCFVSRARGSRLDRALTRVCVCLRA